MMTTSVSCIIVVVVVAGVKEPELLVSVNFVHSSFFQICFDSVCFVI